MRRCRLQDTGALSSPRLIKTGRRRGYRFIGGARFVFRLCYKRSATRKEEAS